MLVGGGLGALIGGDAGDASLGIVTFLGFGAAMVLTTALTYVYPAALTRYAVTDNVGAAFSFGELTDVISGTDYLLAWVFGFVILFVSGMIVVTVFLIPFIGQLIAPAIQFLFSIMACRAFGLAYKAGTETASGS